MLERSNSKRKKDREAGYLDLPKTNLNDLIILDSASSVFEKKNLCLLFLFLCFASPKNFAGRLGSSVMIKHLFLKKQIDSFVPCYSI